jgi:glycosyltransferase involved in cell wall biosynthesis/ADP-heptose:LPS heptosyltransferase
MNGQIEFNKDLITLLWYGDSPCVSTGFGIVSQSVLFRLWQTGKYRIVAVGINDRGEDHPLKKLPNFHVMPCPYLDRDPYGYQVLPEAIKRFKPDVIFALNDIWLLAGDSGKGNLNWWESLLRQHAPGVPWAIYFPIDGRPLAKEWGRVMRSSWSPVVYSKYGYDVIKDEIPDVNPELIYHGVDLETFRPIGDKEKILFVRRHLGIPEDHKLIGVVGRNQPRKNIPLALRIFKYFKDGYKKCKNCGGYASLHERSCELCGMSDFDKVYDGFNKVSMYLHMNLRDGFGFNIPKVIADEKVSGISFNPDHHIAHGVPAEVLNLLYNSFDVMFLPTMSEGFCLPILESMAAGTPVIATAGTAQKELLVDGGGIPIIPQDYIILTDAANVRRHIMRIPDAVNALEKILTDQKYHDELAIKGLRYAASRGWDVSAQQFDELVTKMLNKRISVVDSFNETKEPKILFYRPIGSAGDILITTPVIHAVRELYKDSDIVYAVPEKYIELLDGNDDINKVIPCDFMWDGSRRKGAAQSTKIAKVDLFGVEDRIESALAPNVIFSRQEIYSNHCKVKPESMKSVYNISAQEKEWADALIPQNGEYKIGIKVDTEEPYLAISAGEWIKLIEFFVKRNDEKIYIFVQDRAHFPVDEWMRLVPDGVTVFCFDKEEKPYRKMIAAMNNMNMIVSCDGSFIHFAGMLGKPLVAIYGPNDWRQKLKHYKNVFPVFNSMCQMMPCWRNQNSPCRLTGQQESVCLREMKAGMIVSAIIKAKKESLISENKSVAKTQEEIQRKTILREKRKQRRNRR